MDGMEGVPLNRPTDFSLVTLLADRGALRDAFLALPYGDGSAFYEENEYFRNVAVFGDVFDYILAQLGPATGGRLLDVGADMTWSTARLAAAGWRAVGIDINDHLRASRLWRSQAPAYAVVNMDMHLPGFTAGTFEVVTAFNAFHHTHRLEALVATVVAALRPGRTARRRRTVLVQRGRAGGVRRGADRGRHQRERLSPGGVASDVRPGRARAA